MKKTRILVFLLALSVSANIVIFFGAIYILLTSFFDRNLRHTEQIDFFADTILEQLERNDENLIVNLRNFCNDYRGSYEGAPFMKLMHTHFPVETKNHEFFYQGDYNQRVESNEAP